MRGINKILLENILPAHVADRFLQNLTANVSYHYIVPIKDLIIVRLIMLINFILILTCVRDLMRDD